MKLYLHGARKEQTFKIKNLQFVDGICEHNCLPHYLEKFYGVKDYPPEEEKDNSDDKKDVDLESNNISGTSNEKPEKELNEVVSQLKENLNKKLKSQKDFKQFGSFKAYVKETTGRNPRNKVQANSFMKEYAEANNLVFEE